MCEQNPFDSKAIVYMAKAAKEVLPDTTKEADGVFSTLVGLFNNVVLFPVKVLNLNFQYKLERVKKDLAHRAEAIPLEYVQEPNLLIAGPALEAMKYTIDEPSLRDMFINLLVSSVDKRMDDYIHPAFVEIIKQLSPLDAKFLNIFVERSTYPGITVTIRHSNGTLTPFLHDIIGLLNKAPLFNNHEQLLLTAVLDNLVRLGIIVKNFQIIEKDYDYDTLKTHWQYKADENSKTKEDDVLVMKKYRIELTELGRAFKKCCFD